MKSQLHLIRDVGWASGHGLNTAVCEEWRKGWMRRVLLSLTSKKAGGKGIQRKDNRREKQNIDLSIFFFAFFFSFYCISSFFCRCLTKAVFFHLLYFIPPVSVPGYLLLYGGQWECSWHWAEAWAVLHLMWIWVQINSLTHSRSESEEGTRASSLQAPCCASKVYKHVHFS